MDIICISSDSEASVSSNKAQGNSPSTSQCWNDDIHYVDWNDEAYPAIDYRSDPTDDEAEQINKTSGEIQDFLTLTKLDENNSNSDADEIEIINDITLQNECSRNDSKSDSMELEAEQKNESVKCRTKKINQSRPKLSQEDKEKAKIEKERRKIDRERAKEQKKAEQARQKAVKTALLENQRNIKPEENIKFFKVYIDNEIINSPCGGNIISVLQQNNIQYIVEPQIKNSTVTWTKKKITKTVDDFGIITENIEIQEENQLLYVLDWRKAIELIHRNELLIHVETIKSVYLDKKITLIIYGLRKYFDYRNSKKNRDMKVTFNERKKLKFQPFEKEFEDAPHVSRDQLEFALTDLQLLGKHNHRLLETPEELSAIILNFTKSLSQIEFKLEKQKRQEKDLGWFAKGDSGQCVKIDKSGNGLLRLWQQQICQFSSVGLETAQAIVSNYNSPSMLVNQYKKCSNSEGELFLQNIQIRRNAGILSSTRRVGPQLSKKIYKFFMSKDPDEEL